MDIHKSKCQFKEKVVTVFKAVIEKHKLNSCFYYMDLPDSLIPNITIMDFREFLLELIKDPKERRYYLRIAPKWDNTYFFDISFILKCISDCKSNKEEIENIKKLINLKDAYERKLEFSDKQLKFYAQIVDDYYIEIADVIKSDRIKNLLEQHDDKLVLVFRDI